jgi:hypothetical protein
LCHIAHRAAALFEILTRMVATTGQPVNGLEFICEQLGFDPSVTHGQFKDFNRCGAHVPDQVRGSSAKVPCFPRSFGCELELLAEGAVQLGFPEVDEVAPDRDVPRGIFHVLQSLESRCQVDGAAVADPVDPMIAGFNSVWH